MPPSIGQILPQIAGWIRAGGDRPTDVIPTILGTGTPGPGPLAGFPGGQEVEGQLRRYYDEVMRGHRPNLGAPQLVDYLSTLRADLIVRDLEERGASRTDQQVAQRIAQIWRVRNQPGGRNQRERERAFDEGGLRLLDWMIGRAAVDPRYRTAQVVDAIFLLPASIDPDYWGVYNRWRYFDAPDGESAGPARPSLQEHLYRLLGCEGGADVSISTLDPAWTVRLFRVVRQALALGNAQHLRLFLRHLTRCQNPEELQRLITFFESLLAWPEKEKIRFLRTEYLRAGPALFEWGKYINVDANPDLTLAVESDDQLLTRYAESNSPERIRQRLLRLCTRDSVPQLVQLGLPILQRSLDSYCDQHLVSEPLQHATLALEARVAWGEEAPESAGPLLRTEHLAHDILLLIDPLQVLMQYGRLYDQGDFRFNQGNVIRAAEQMAHEILTLPEPLRAMAIGRLLLEGDNPLWSVQTVIAIVEGALILEGVEDRRHLFQRRLMQLAYNFALPVRVKALQEAVRHAPPRENETESVRYWHDLGFEETLGMFLRDRWFRQNHSAFLGNLWEQLPTPLRHHTLRATWLLTDAAALRGDPLPYELLDLLTFLQFLVQHAADLPDDIREGLVRRTDLAPRIIAALEKLRPERREGDAYSNAFEIRQNDFWARVDAALDSAIFLIENGGDSLPAVERWIWAVLEDRVHWSDPLCWAILLLGELHKKSGDEWNPTLRGKALEGSLRGFVSEVMDLTHSGEPLREAAFHSQSLPTVTRLLLGATREERDAVRSRFVSAVTSDSVAYYDTLSNARAFVLLSPLVPEWQTAESLDLFRVHLGEVRTQRLAGLTTGLPARHFPALFQMAFEASTLNQRSDRQDLQRLLQHLIDSTRTAGEFLQVVSFYQLFSSLTDEVRLDFVRAVTDDSRRTARGLGRPVEGAQPLFISPTKARDRLSHYLVDRFIQSIDLPAGEAAALKGDIQRRSRLWEADHLLVHLASLASFSTREGTKAIAALTRQLIRPEAVAATREAGSRRLMNPTRYESMSKAFPPDFVAAWANEDQDRVIPIGELDPEGVLSTDPVAFRRAKYEYATLQMATHLNIAGVSHLSYADRLTAMQRHLNDLSASNPAVAALLRPFVSLLEKISRLEEVTVVEINRLLDELKKRPEVAQMAGGRWGDQWVRDLQQFKAGLIAPPLRGKAWLVVTPNAADFVGSGRNPVTCQDPTFATEQNRDGQPVNRPREGRFLYAKVVLAEEVRLVDGVAVYSEDAMVIDRAHLEATTETGRPDPAARPHLLVERDYPQPGFIYKDLFGRALNLFAISLGLDPEQQAHNQFTGQGMSRYPHPLPDETILYRDTFV